MGLIVETNMIHHGFDGETCFVHLRGDRVKEDGYVMTSQKLTLSGCDLFGPLHSMKSCDGVFWTEPEAEQAFLERMEDGQHLFCCDFTPAFHQKTGKLLGIGHTTRYDDAGVIAVPRRRDTCYSVYDDAAGHFGEWRTVAMPDEDFYLDCGAGSAQRFDLPNGDILLPLYFKAPGDSFYQSAVLTLGFDGRLLETKEISSPVCVDSEHRGAYEPSITFADGRYFMTLRTDAKGYVCVGDTPSSFDTVKPWQWETGEEIGNYNTQQHFVTLNHHLYLVYTRRGLHNDHVFRHRAPLLIARVDTRRLCLIRETETAVVPQRGARLGNFGVSQLGENEAWVTVTEWMQPIGCERFGSDNAFYIAKISEDPA